MKLPRFLSDNAQRRFQDPFLSPRLVTAVLSAFIALCSARFIQVYAAETSHPKGSGSSQTSNLVEMIDRTIHQTWEENKTHPAKKATNPEWCRRVYLDLIGRVPTVKELDAYGQLKSPTRRFELVDRMLGSEYLEDFADHWATFWTNTLIGRTGGRERRSLINRAALEDFLRRSVLENKPYDLLVHELITATGSAYPEGEDFNGAVNFLVEKMGENGIQATAKAAEIFLGTAVQCTQCHNHPFNEYRQNQFWELNAFFRQAVVERIRDPDDDNRRLGKLINRDFAGEGRMPYRDRREEIYLEQRDGVLVDRDAGQLYDAPIYYELRNGQMQVAYPVFIDGAALADKLSDVGTNLSPDYGNSGYLKHVDRRHELAKLMVSSRDFDQALVNRMWAHFLGHGFTKPIDDMGPHNPPSHPELLDELGAAFRESGFDMKELMRWIVLSEPYALSSRISKGNRKDDPSLGAAPQFSRFYLRQMQAEQLYASLLIATKADATVDQSRRDMIRERWLQQFNTAFGTDDGGEATSFNGSIPQALTLMNGDLIRRACSTGSGSFLDKVANDWDLSNRDKINYLYRAALARYPSKEETNVCNALLASRRGDVVGSLQDIWWAILNSNEFILIH